MVVINIHNYNSLTYFFYFPPSQLVSNSGKQSPYSQKYIGLTMSPYSTSTCGAWWRIDRVDAFQTEGRGFESGTSGHVGTLGKSLTSLSP